jgi:acetyl esterase/lipase
MVSAAAQKVIADMQADSAGPLRTLEEERADWEAAVKGDKLPEGSLVSGVTLNGVPCEWVERADSGAEIVLLVHGGGFSSGSPRTHRKFAAVFSRASGQRVLVPDYRLAPEDPYPEGLDDIVAVYAALIEAGSDPGSITFSGDSAGAGLALAAVLKLRDIEAPLPGRLVLMSPWVDLSLTGESHDTNAMHPNPTEPELRRAADWYVGEMGLADPGVSPLFADLSGLPRMLVQAGGHEVLLDDAVRLVERANAAGSEATLTVTAGMWHVFQHFDCPEARAAVEEAAAFVNNAPEDADPQGELDVILEEAVRRG